MPNILFITGTDTGAGKTVLTALLLAHLRDQGVDALAVKPFCSGSRADARLLRSLGENRLPLETVNPYYFDKPLAPAAAAPAWSRRVRLDAVTAGIRAVAAQCELLLVEGSGGLLVPLGAKFGVADLILDLKCPVLVAAPNRLGTINHTLLTLNWMEHVGIKCVGMVLMGVGRPDLSVRTNATILQKMVKKTVLFELPYKKNSVNSPREIKKRAKKMKKVLAAVGNHDNFVTLFGRVRKTKGC